MKKQDTTDPLNEKQSEEQIEKQKPEKSKDPGSATSSLLDDHEEEELNEAYDEVLAHDENAHSEEEEKEKASMEDDPEELADADADADATGNPEPAQEPVSEKVNYALLSKEDLVKLMAETLDNPSKANFRNKIEQIRQGFSEKQQLSLEEKKAQFLEGGGTLEDFKPAEDPLDLEMKALINKYRVLKAEYTRDLEKTKNENLEKRQRILEELRILMESQETFEVTFRKFKDLQRQWFAAGIVPQQNLKDLWDSYNYFVEKFNDYVRLNRDLRTLDLKKNLELKVQLCEKTEELDKEPNIVQAFKTLQKFHSRWREIGPVPRDNRDEIWDRFKQATSLINRKHQEYHSRLKDSLHENLAKKEALCVQVEELSAQNYDTHSAWAEKTKVVLEIQKAWKTIGYAPKKDNNAIYARFRKACDVFFGNKANFYSMAYNEQKENLKLKTEIAEKAEALRESKDWKVTTNELIKLQKQWKSIGPVPRRDSDKLWKRFRSACDTFFTNKSSFFDDTDSSFDDNLKAKTDLIAEMENFVPGDNRKSNLDALTDFQARFDEIGYVPSNKKEWIREEFRASQDRLLEKIGLDNTERSLFRFRSRIKGILQTPRAEMKLNFERDKLVSKLQQLQGDIKVWENNIGFFKLSESSEDTLLGFREKIDSARERITLLEKKIRMLDDMENAN